MSSDELHVWFVTTTGKAAQRTLAAAADVGAAKAALLADWPAGWTPRVRDPAGIVMVRRGTVLADGDALRCAADGAATTVHVLLKAGHGAPPSPYIDAETGEVNEDAMFHFHGVSVSAEEVEQMRTVFERQCGADRLLPFDRVHSFLRTYWRFGKRQQFIDEARAFPTDKVFELRRKYLASAETTDDHTAPRLTLDDFLELFFLFDQHEPSADACVHGARGRVAQATEQLASQLHPDSAFDRQLFDQLFDRVDADADHTLSCLEVELLYYMYSAKKILAACDDQEEVNSA